MPSNLSASEQLALSELVQARPEMSEALKKFCESQAAFHMKQSCSHITAQPPRTELAIQHAAKAQAFELFWSELEKYEANQP